jgi:hypothetical protein
VKLAHDIEPIWNLVGANIHRCPRLQVEFKGVANTEEHIDGLCWLEPPADTGNVSEYICFLTDDIQNIPVSDQRTQIIAASIFLDSIPA